MLPKLSVIIPAYNHELYVLMCLDSLKTSYNGILEVIICDDNSKDSTGKKISDYIYKNKNEPGISYKFIQHKCNKGVSATLNECISLCETDYIYIIASDDFVEKDGLNRAMELLLSSNYDAVISDCHVVDENNHKTHESAFFGYRSSSLKKINASLSKELVFNWVVPGPSLLIKKNIYKKIGKYDESLMAEDRDFYLRLLSKAKVVFNASKLANYRVHSSNFSRTLDYVNNKDKEFALVNFRNSDCYDGISRLYLKTYKLDILGCKRTARFLRKTFKIIYSFF